MGFVEFHTLQHRDDRLLYIRLVALQADFIHLGHDNAGARCCEKGVDLSQTSSPVHCHILPVDLLFIGMLYAASDRNIYFTCGIIIGFVVGLTIGLRNLYRFLADYKEIFSAND